MQGIVETKHEQEADGRRDLLRAAVVAPASVQEERLVRLSATPRAKIVPGARGTVFRAVLTAATPV